MDVLTNRRNLQRQLIGGASGFTRKDEFFQRTTIQLEKRLAVLKENFDDFMKDHRAIVETLREGDDFDAQNRIAMETQELFIETAAIMEQRLADMKEVADAPKANAERDAARARCQAYMRTINQAEEFVEGEQFEQQTLNELRVRRHQWAAAYERLEIMANGVLDLLKTAHDIETHHAQMAIMENKYLQIMGIVDNTIASMEDERAEEHRADDRRADYRRAEERRAEDSPRERGLRLESIKPTKFEGDYAKWKEWRAMFDSLIHNRHRLSDTEKFHYLRRSIGGTAEAVLAGWHVTGENYQSAYQSLCEVFENNYRITMAHLDVLQNVPKLQTESHEGLRSMIDTINRSKRQLKVVGSPVDHWDQILVHSILTRMPSNTLAQWNTENDLVEMPSLDEVMKFLERRARSIVNLTSNKPTKEFEFRRANTVAPPTGQPGQPTNTMKCFKCSGNHPLYRCFELKKQPLAERTKFIRSLKRCFNCLQQGHAAGAKECKSGPCPICRNGHHNSLLCPQQQQQQQNGNKPKRVFTTVQSQNGAESQTDSSGSQNFC